MRIMWLSPVTSAENVAWSVLIVLTLGVHTQWIELACSFPGVLWLSVFYLSHPWQHAAVLLSCLFLGHKGGGQREEEEYKIMVDVSFLRYTATWMMLSFLGRAISIGLYGIAELNCYPFSLWIRFAMSPCQRDPPKAAWRRVPGCDLQAQDEPLCLTTWESSSAARGWGIGCPPPPHAPLPGSPRARRTVLMKWLVLLPCALKTKSTI